MFAYEFVAAPYRTARSGAHIGFSKYGEVFKKFVEPPSALTRPTPIFKRLARSPEPKWQRVKVGLLLGSTQNVERKTSWWVIPRRVNACSTKSGHGVLVRDPLRPAKFAIFDVFTDEAECQAHLHGIITATLKGKSVELLVRPPVIEKVDVIAAKLAEFG